MNNIISDKNIKSLANQIEKFKENIILLFALNGTGKTRLSMNYCNRFKHIDNDISECIYYNSYSEDLFQWCKKEEEIFLKIIHSSLNCLHSLLNESIIREKLEVYRPKFVFKFNYYDDTALGIKSISFYPKSEKKEEEAPMKISRGEEQIFIWCFFLAIFDVQEWKNKTFLFIDDPVSSLDDNNIFVTATTLLELIKSHYQKNKIIITTHHAGFFSLLSNWLTKDEKSNIYHKHTIKRIIKGSNNKVALVTFKKDVFLYHLELIQTLKQAIIDKSLYNFHFAILRQIMEVIASFLGCGRVSYVLEQIGINDVDMVMKIINALSHEQIFRFQANIMVPDNEELFLDVFNKLQNKYNFVIHVEEK